VTNNTPRFHAIWEQRTAEGASNKFEIKSNDAPIKHEVKLGKVFIYYFIALVSVICLVPSFSLLMDAVPFRIKLRAPMPRAALRQLTSHDDFVEPAVQILNINLGGFCALWGNSLELLVTFFTSFILLWINGLAYCENALSFILDN
jgi:hypothetical protein